MIVYRQKEEQIELYEAIGRLSNDKDFQRIQKWFSDTLDELRSASDNMTDNPEKPILSWNQGSRQLIDGYLRTAAEHKEILKKLVSA